MTRTSFLSWKINWMRVWNLCCPFLFCNIVCWLWVWYFLPAKLQIDEINENNTSHTVKVEIENRKLKKEYTALYSEAREKLHYVQGQKTELHRLLREWQKKAIDLEIRMATEKTDFGQTKQVLFAPTLQGENSGVQSNKD